MDRVVQHHAEVQQKKVNDVLLSSIPEDSDLEISATRKHTSARASTIDKAAVERSIAEAADYPEGMHITRCNQVLIEVLEATDLKASGLSGLSNPYAEVSLKQRHRSRKNLFSKRRRES